MIEPTIVLLIWPVVAICIMASKGMATGVIWATVLGYLFLPDSFNVNLPGLPPYSKYTAVSLGLALGVMLFARRINEDKPIYTDGFANTVFLALAILLVTSPMGTFLDNRGVLVTGGTVRSGLSFRDVISTVSQMGIVLVPYYVGRRWLATPEQQARLLTALVIMAMIYSLLAMYEARMSPQLNRTFYGYFPHSWAQHLRGGYRPVVFLRHGLWLGFLLLTMILASCAMSRQDPERRALYLLAALWLLPVLFLSRNLGATMLAVIFAPVVLFLSTSMQARIAAVIAVIFLSFPALRQAEVLTFDGFVSQVEKAAPERAASLQYRFDNEHDLLARAGEKPIFGWGGWARALVFDDQGRNTSVQDGTWIIVLGERGWLGYIAYFGLITFPLLMLRRTIRRKTLEPATAGLAIITAVNLIYIIPNSTLSSIGWLTFGALAGYVQFDMRRAGQDDDPEPEGGSGEDLLPGGRRRTRYSRFGQNQVRARDRQPVGAVPRAGRAEASFRR